MAEATKIEWCDRTWSPWEGCQKVSPACENCYASARNERFAGGANWGPGAPRRMTADASWTKPLKWQRDAVRLGRPISVFPSLCDPFDNAAPPGGRDEFANIIVQTPNLRWLLLTKRIGNALDMLIDMFPDGVPHNVRIGATVVNDEEWKRDFPKMKPVFVAVGRPLFLSIEPMLGRMDLDAFGPVWRRVIGWVIAGGESGPRARAIHPDWLRSLRDQCAGMPGFTASVPFLMKQWGEWVPRDQLGIDPRMPVLQSMRKAMARSDGTIFGEAGQYLGTGTLLVRAGKKLAGRTLDGVIHNGMPA